MAVKVPYQISLASIENVVPELIVGIEGDRSLTVDQVAALGDAAGGSLMFVSKENIDISKVTDQIQPSIVLVAPHFKVGSEKHLWVRVKNPRLAFCRLAVRSIETHSIHVTATVDPEAQIGLRAQIGANAVIGKVQVGDDVIIGPNVVIEDGVKIGNRVHIKAGAIIGGSGFGFEKDQHGIYHEFYHWGGVEIEDDVCVGSNTCIDRGTFGNTILRQGVKVDNLVHVAHNCVVGRNSILVALSELSGSVKIGEGVWVAPGAMVVNGLKIGNGAFLGIGAICTQDLPENHRLIPAFSTAKPPKGHS